MATAKKPATPAASAEGKVKGPASYFPSIEKTYGAPIAHWQQIIRANAGLKHMELVTLLNTEHGMGQGHSNADVAHTLAGNS